jgi:hypothetical protein
MTFIRSLLGPLLGPKVFSHPKPTVRLVTGVTSRNRLRPWYRAHVSGFGGSPADHQPWARFEPMHRAWTLLDAVLWLAVLVPLVSGALNGTCRANLVALPAGVSRCSSSDVSEIWTPGSCVDRSGKLVEDGRILLSEDFASALSGNTDTAQSKCTALCKQEAAPLGWHQCSEEGKECRCRGTVRFGNSASWVEKYVNGAIGCTGQEFGNLAGKTKPVTCQCRPMFTGCELVASTEENKGCYVHTSTRVFTGSGAAKAQCWSDEYFCTCACHQLLLSSVVSTLYLHYRDAV